MQTTRRISTMIRSNVVRSKLIILINEEINKAIWPGQNHGAKKKFKKNNEANWMVSNSAKLDCRTK